MLKPVEATFGQFEGVSRFFFCWKLARSHGKLINYGWNRFSTGTRIRLPLYILEDYGWLRDTSINWSKLIYCTFLPFNLKSFEPLLSSTSLSEICWCSRWPCQSRTPLLCVSPRQIFEVFMGISCEERASNCSRRLDIPPLRVSDMCCPCYLALAGVRSI